jgi:hypothetical protein
MPDSRAEKNDSDSQSLENVIMSCHYYGPYSQKEYS